MPTVLINSKKYNVNPNQTIFDELEKQGLQLPHGCLAGSCGACKVEIIAGAENLSTPSAVELDTISSLKDGNKIIRLSCRAKITGDVEIHY